MPNMLLIVDPQEDFCDPGGALYVKGADKDMGRLCDWVARRGQDIDSIAVTLDCHAHFDIGHPAYWLDEEGSHPEPFTSIRLDDVVSGKFKTSDPAFGTKARKYLETLEANQRPGHTVWPYHCLVGQEGMKVVKGLVGELDHWQSRYRRPVQYFVKGLNPHTEHYSAVIAEVPDPFDRHTHKNDELLDLIQRADEVYVAGEASSHCVKHTVLDATTHLSSKPDTVGRKFRILKDAMSPVPGFEESSSELFKEVASSGGKFVSITSELQEG